MKPLSILRAESFAPYLNARSILDWLSQGIAAHRILYVIAVATFTLSLLVAPISGNWPDFDIVFDFGTYFVFAIVLGILLGITVKFVQLVLFERPDSPTLELLKFLGQTLTREDRLSNSIHCFILLLLFVSGFGILKGAIGLLNPFHWDPFFRDLDIALSGGRMPHEWLDGLLSTPLAVWLVNLNYNLWYFVVLGTYFAVGMAARNSPDRMRFLNAFFLLWLAAGIVVAFVFSSAGPVYYERLGLGADYKPLMDTLHAAARHHEIWALATQDALWDGYTGLRDGSAGISAFPSLHVATSVLVALYASHSQSRLAIPAWLFAAGIMLGSVVLAWHYAVDGYAGAVLALVIWKVSGWKIWNPGAHA